MFEADLQVHTPPDDTVIWRYLDLEKLLSLVSTGRLYLPRLDKFDDPWEGAWPQSVIEHLRASTEMMRKTMMPNVPDLDRRLVVEFARQTFFCQLLARQWR